MQDNESFEAPDVDGAECPFHEGEPTINCAACDAVRWEFTPFDEATTTTLLAA